MISFPWESCFFIRGESLGEPLKTPSCMYKTKYTHFLATLNFNGGEIANLGIGTTNAICDQVDVISTLEDNSNNALSTNWLQLEG